MKRIAIALRRVAGWYNRLSKLKKVFLWIGVVFVGLIVIVAVFGEEAEPDVAPAQEVTTPLAQTPEPASSPTTAPTATSTPTPTEGPPPPTLTPKPTATPRATATPKAVDARISFRVERYDGQFPIAAGRWEVRVVANGNGYCSVDLDGIDMSGGGDISTTTDGGTTTQVINVKSSGNAYVGCQGCCSPSVTWTATFKPVPD